MVKDTTLYDKLHVSPDADDSAIQKAYFRLSKKYHPDKHVNSEDHIKAESTKKFHDIGEAKEILLDKEKRKLYDQIGMDMFKPEFQGGSQQPDFGSMFGHGFPFSMPGMPGMGPRNKPPENIVENINVTLEQIYNEESYSFNYKYKHYCLKCDGEGTKDGKVSSCAMCNGKGMRAQVIQMGPMIQQVVSQCNACNGKGKIVNENDKCTDCKGSGHIQKDKNISIPLKAGLDNGNKINLQGKGHQFKNIKTDLIIVVNVAQHNIFKRHNNDLFIEVELKLFQALFGFDKIITHLDNRKLHISSSGKTDFNMFRKIANEGMKNLNSNSKGDLYIKFNINLPNLATLPTETKTQLKSIIQSFDKQETQNELQITKMDNLVKTVITDCKSDHIMQLNQLFETIKHSKQTHPFAKQNNSDSDEHDQFQGHGSNVQCSQQ